MATRGRHSLVVVTERGRVCIAGVANGDAQRRVGAWPSRWAWLKERALVACECVAIKSAR